MARYYRDTAALADTALRTVPLLPDSTAGQFHFCEGLEVALDLVAARSRALAAALQRQREEADLVERLAGLLAALAAGRPLTPDAFNAVAEEVLADAREAGPLVFVTPDGPPARRVAAHSLTVARVAARVVRHDLALRPRAQDVVHAALIHDVGMLRAPEALFGQPGPLDDDQKRAVEAHCRAGVELATALRADAPWLAEAAGAHHERLDGTGYPGGLREHQVGAITKLIAVCDVYAALCVARPHRRPFEPRTALTEVLLLADKGLLDRDHAERLLHLSFYPVGTAVEMNDGSVGMVVAAPVVLQDLSSPARPVVALLLDGDGNALAGPQHVDLARCEDRSVVRALGPDERRERLGRRFPEWA
jgi:hypothetical protein